MVHVKVCALTGFSYLLILFLFCRFLTPVFPPDCIPSWSLCAFLCSNRCLPVSPELEAAEIGWTEWGGGGGRRRRGRRFCLDVFKKPLKLNSHGSTSSAQLQSVFSAVGAPKQENKTKKNTSVSSIPSSASK